MLAGEIRDFLIDAVVRNGGHSSGLNLGVVGADHRAAPGLRLARATASSSTPATRPTCTSCSPAGRTASTGCASAAALSGYPSRAESEHDIVRELARLHRPVLRRRAGQGLRSCAASRPHRGRGDRRRRADRRHGLGGAQQHRRGQEQPAGHRRQRQRPLLHADDRRARRAPGHGPAVAALRARAGVIEALSAARRWSARRCTTTLHADQEGPQGRRCSRRCSSRTSASSTSGPVDGHDRAAGRARAARSARGLRRPGDRARDHPQGVRLPPGRGTTTRTACTARRRSTRRPAGRTGRAERRWTDAFSDELVAIGASAPDVVGDHRRDARTRPACAAFAEAYPDRCLRRRHRRAARGHLARPGSRSAACTRWSRSTRPSSTGPSTRCCWTSRCTGCR